jgi:hypothetical protein
VAGSQEHRTRPSLLVETGSGGEGLFRTQTGESLNKDQ